MQNILYPYCAAEKNLNLHLDQPKPRHLKKKWWWALNMAEWISYPSTRNKFWPFKTYIYIFFQLFFNALPLFFKHELLILGCFEKIHVFSTLQFHLFI